MKKISFILFSIFISTNVDAQSFIKGQIIDSLKAPIPYCALGLIKSNDSIVVKGILSDDNGYFTFDNVSNGSYKIKADNMGSSIIFSNNIIIDSLKQDNINIGSLIFNSAATNLNEVEVAVIKKPIEFKNGNIIVNIDGSPLAIGNTAFDLLSRLPGVTVIDNVISIQGTAGVKLYMDDRLQNFSGNQLVNLLKSINASSIDKIEIMKNPPVKYDASGTAGIINIKTKKLKLVGFSGTVYNTYTQAYFYNTLSGLDLNYKGKKVNFYSSISYVDESYYRYNLYNREVSFNNITTQVNQTYKERQHNKFGGLNFGADYFINSKNIFGFKVASYAGNENNNRVGDMTIINSDLGYDYNSYGSLRENPWSYTNANFNFEHLFDTVGTKIIFSSDYTYNYDLYTGDYFNHFFNYNPSPSLPSLLFKTYNYIYLNNGASKLDFEKSLTKTMKLQTGLKATYTNMISDFAFSNMNNFTGEYIKDSSLTNTFTYKELVSAGYINLQESYKKFNFQAGLRGENTTVNTISQSTNVKYNRNYFGLFPLISMDYNASTKHTLSISYNRRLERPNYNSFNPNRQFRNYLNSEIGNPKLLPMYFNMVTVTHNYKGMLNTSLSYNKITNIFFSYNTQNDSTKENLTQTINFKHRDVFAFDVFYQKNIFKWWITTFNTSFIYFNYSGVLNGMDYKTEQYSYYIVNNNQFIFKKNYKAELNLFYIGPWLDGITISNARWNLDIAIKKTFLNNKLNVAIGCNDIFFTSVNSGSVNYYNMKSNFNHRNDTRRIRFSVSYNFGKFKIQQREVKSNQEESNRLGH